MSNIYFLVDSTLSSTQTKIFGSSQSVNLVNKCGLNMNTTTYFKIKNILAVLFNKSFSQSRQKSWCLHVVKLRCIFQNFILKISECQKSWKNAPFFKEKAKFQLADARYDFHTFLRHSSEYLQHSVFSLKKFGSLEVKLKQKARPPSKSPILRGVRGVPRRI